MPQSSTSPPRPTLTPQAACSGEMSSILHATADVTALSNGFPHVDPGNRVDVPLVMYTVQGEDIEDPVLQTVPLSLRRYQDNMTAQQSAWTLFTALIPRGPRQIVGEYEVVTDGPGNLLAAVEQTATDPNRWVLEVDVADVADTKNLVFTLLHEFGHLLTLNPAQVPPDVQVFKHPNSGKIYDRAVASCPDYFPGEGCSLPKSYLNTFFNRFWNGIYSEWQAIDGIQDADRRQRQLDAFYSKYQDRFLDSYAATSPAEDIAESWAIYVLSPRPTANSVADQKLLFFDAYPELASLRGQILENLCAARP